MDPHKTAYYYSTNKHANFMATRTRRRRQTKQVTHTHTHRQRATAVTAIQIFDCQKQKQSHTPTRHIKKGDGPARTFGAFFCSLMISSARDAVVRVVPWERKVEAIGRSESACRSGWGCCDVEIPTSHSLTSTPTHMCGTHETSGGNPSTALANTILVHVVR